jgi:hypothetical protein
MKFARNGYPVIIGLLVFAAIVSGQKTWEKPYEKWSKDDALKIVSESPWSRTYQSIAASTASAQGQIAMNQRDTPNGGGNGALAGSAIRDLGPAPVVIRLHSGIPIRQAISRGRQIAAGYDKMDEQRKKEFDASTKGFLECAICKSYYVISLTKLPDSTSQSVDEAMFQRFTLNDLKGNVWLVNDQGVQRELFQFTPPKKTGESAYLFFARQDDSGKLLITPENKEFKLVFGNNFFVTSNPYSKLVPRTLAFKVSNLMIGSEIAF